MLVVFGSRIYSARDATKVDTRLPDAFDSPGFGPMGEVDGETVIFRRCVPPSPILDPPQLAAPVDIVHAYVGCDGRLVDAARAASVGLVIAALGRGNTNPPFFEAVLRWLSAGKPVVVSSRAQHGRVGATYGFRGGGRDVARCRRDLRGRPEAAARADRSHAGVGCEPDGTGLARDIRRVVTTMGGGDAVEHGATEEGVTLRPPASVVDIAKQLEAAGHETWCVGGAVRDALLGHPHSDWDLATAARPEEVMRLFPRRTIPVGVAHGTVGVLDRSRVLHEVTTFRRDVRTDGRHAEVEFGASLDEDLARRDFTINAIAYSPTRHVMRDPFHGREDMARRVVRAVATRLIGCERIGFARSARCDSRAASSSRSIPTRGPPSWRAHRSLRASQPSG